jgi:hypothetical protein
MIYLYERLKLNILDNYYHLGQDVLPTYNDLKVRDKTPATDIQSQRKEQ